MSVIQHDVVTRQHRHVFAPDTLSFALVTREFYFYCFN